MNEIFDAYCLKPAEALVCDQSRVVYTILGSCVSVIMHSPRYRLTGMTHAIMPSIGNNCSSEQLKYADGCVRYLHNHFRSRGLKPSELTVKVFGGGQMTRYSNRDRSWVTVAELNVEVTITLLKELGYRIAAQDTGGDKGRKIYLYCDSGEVLLKRISQFTETR